MNSPLEHPDIARRLEEAYRSAGITASLTDRLPSLSEFACVDRGDPKIGKVGPDSRVLLHDSLKPSDRPIVEDLGAGNLIVVGRNVRLGRVLFKCTGRNGVIIVESDVGFTKNCAVQTRSRNNVIVIGRETTWETGEMLAVEDNQGIVVGPVCMFSSEISMRTSDGHPIYDIETQQRINPPGWIHIGARCWLGRGSRVSKGVRLAEGTVVGQASIVTRDTEPNSVYAGAPARLVRAGVRWERKLPRD